MRSPLTAANFVPANGILLIWLPVVLNFLPNGCSPEANVRAHRCGTRVALNLITPFVSRLSLKGPEICSAELKGPLKGPRIRPEIFDFEPDFGLKLGQTKPSISGTAPTNWHTMISNESGHISACFGDDPNLLNCEIAQRKSSSPPLPL